MIDQAYRKIGEHLEKEVYQDTQAFHAKTNNCVLTGGPATSFYGPAHQKLIQDMEYTDIPITPFDSSRLFLPEERPPLDMPIRQRSAEQFREECIPFHTLSQLLKNAFGNILKDPQNFRPYPSGGALYSVQVIVGIRAHRVHMEENGVNLTTGFYHYRPTLNALDPLVATEDSLLVELMINDDQRPLTCFNFCLIYVSFLPKAMFKYSYRGYRLSLLEAGSMYQQASLCAKTLGLQERVWSYFEDFRVCKILGLNPVCYVPLISQMFGGSHV